MFSSHDMERIFLQYLTKLYGKKKFKTGMDLNYLDSGEILDLADKMPDELLPLFVQALKSGEKDGAPFQKLMGDHEENNRVKVDRFFNRYMKLILGENDKIFNPLIAFIPPESFHDLAFIQSREVFFKSQTIDTINEFLSTHFNLKTSFQPTEQENAWRYFWKELLNGQ